MIQYFILGACIVPLGLLVRSGKFFRTFLFTALTGLGALAAVCWLGAYTGVQLTFNPFTAGVSCLLGVPGVIGMLLFRMLCAL